MNKASNHFGQLWQDARYTVRQLRRAPFFTVTVLLTLALAVGATAAMVGVLRATLLNPLPYREPNQLLEITDRSLKGLPSPGLMSVPRAGDVGTLQSHGHLLFSSTGFYYHDESTLMVAGHAAMRVPAVAVSGSFFPTLATPALLGRTLTLGDDVPNGPELVVLSYRLWTTAFAADPKVIGRSVRLGSSQATVIGVMPPHFEYPAGNQLWHPGHVFPANFSYRGDGSRFVILVGRLAPGESIASANAATTQLATQLGKAFPQTDAVWGFALDPLRETLFGQYRQALWLISAAVGLVLLVATVNIAGLQLSRNARRSGEFAVRTALGVTRARLVRQLLTESLLLISAGGVAGIALAGVLLRVLASRLPAALLSVQAPTLDPWVLGSSIGIAFVVGVGTALLPIRQSATARPLGSFGTARTATKTRLFGGSFIALQVALSLVLLTLSASVLGGLYRLLTMPLGFDASQVQTFSLELPWTTAPEQIDRVQKQAEAAFAAMPGVTSAGAISALPLTPFSFRRSFDIAGQPVSALHDTVVAEGRAMTPGYLKAMQIPLLAGRGLSERDAEPNAPSVVLINQTLARRFFAGRDPIGQRLTGGLGVRGVGSSEIVGVVGDVQGTGGSLAAAPRPEVYNAASGASHMQFALRSSLPATTLEPTIRRIVASIDPAATIGDIKPLSSSVDRVLLQPRLNAGLLTAFAGLSMLLVMIGVYGLLAFEVASRTREIALRMALGSTRARVFALLMAESSRLLAAGLALGLAGSYAASRLLGSMSVTPTIATGPLIAATVLLLTAAVYGATLLPARRAALIQPTQALRAE